MKTESTVSFVFIVLLLVSVFPTSVSSGAAESHVAPGFPVVDPPTADWWPMFHHDLMHTGYSTSTAPDTNQTLWSTPIWLPDWETWTAPNGSVAGMWGVNTIGSSPVVVDGMVFVGSMGGKVCALSESTGAIIWTYYAADDVLGSLAVSDGMVFGGNIIPPNAEGECTTVFALNEVTGALIWSHKTRIVGSIHPGVVTSPAVANGIVYVSSEDGNVYAFDETTGTVVWIYTTNWLPSSDLWPPSAFEYSSPAVVGGIVYIGSTDNRTYALNATTGKQIWNYTTDWKVFSSPAVANGIVYTGPEGNYIYALNATDGTLVWRHNTGSWLTAFSSPAVAEGVVYIGTYDGLYALDATNGAYMWKYWLNDTTTDTGDPIYSSPAVADGKVYFGAHDGKVYALDATTGTFIWSYLTGSTFPRPNARTRNQSVGVWSSPAIADGKVFVGSDDGRVYAFGSLHEEHNHEEHNYIRLVFDVSPRVAGLIIDSVQYSGDQIPVSFRWAIGSVHSFEVPRIRIQGQPGVRYVFEGWNDGGSSAERTLNVSSPATFIAQYGTEYLVSVDTPFGSPVGSDWYKRGDWARLSVQTVVDWGSGTRKTLEGWYKDGLKIGSTGSVSINVSEPVLLVLNWDTEYLVSLSSSYGTPSGGGWYMEGEMANFSIQSTIDQGNGTRRTLGGWYKDGSLLSREPNSSFVVDAPMTLVTGWITEYQVQVSSERGTTSGGGWFVVGDSTTVSITPVLLQKDFFTDYIFEGWKEDGATVSTLATYSFTVSAPADLVASWKTELNLVTVGGVAGGALLVVGIAVVLFLRRSKAEEGTRVQRTEEAHR